MDRADGSIVIDTKMDNTGFKKGSEELRNATQRMMDQVNTFGGKVKRVALSTGKLLGSTIAKNIKTGVVTAISGVGIAIGGALVAAKKTTVALQNLAGGAVLGGLAKLGGVLKTIAGNLITLAKNGFSAAVGFIKSAVTEGVKDLAKQNATFNAAMSQLMTAFYTLKGSITAAFAPLVEFVAPALSQFIYLISEAISKVGMLMAALTGKEFVKAVPVQQDYADSLKSTSEKEKEARDALKEQKKAMDKDRKAAKKLNKALEKTIAGFDDIQTLKSNSDDDDDFDFDTDVDIPETPKVEYTTQPVDNGFLDFAQKLKDMFKNADFTDLGRMLGEKLRDALNKIPWDQIKETVRNIAKSIATFLNGFLETPGLFEAIGRTLAEGLNTAFEFLNSFAENFHFASLGSAIGKAINSALQTIDWPLIYETFRNWGTGIADALNSFLYETDFSLVGQTLANAVNALFTGLLAFTTTFDWAAMGTAVKDGILGAANGIDWPMIFATFESYGRGMGEAIQNAINDPAVWTALFEILSNGITASLTMLNAFITAINWPELGQNIGTGMNNAVESFDWNLLSDTLIKVINGAFDLWYNWVTTFDFLKFGTHIGETLSAAVNGINWEEGGAAVAASINALFEALTGFVTGTDWKALGKAVVDTIAGYFGEMDWSVFGKWFTACFTALADFLLGVITETDWMQIPTNIGNAIGEYLQGFDWSEMAAKTMELLGAALGAAILLVAGFAEAVAGWIKDGLKGIWDYFGNEIDDCGGNIALGILKGIGDVFVNIAKWLVDNVFTPFVNGIKSVFGIHSPADTMLEFGGYIIEGILQGIKDGLAGIVDWLTEHVFNPIVNGIKTLFGIGEGNSSVFLEFGGNLIEGLKNGLENAVDGINDWIDKHITGPILGFFKDFFGIGEDNSSVFLEFGGNLIEGLKNGLSGAVDKMKGWVDEHVTGPVLGFFKDLFGIGSPSTIFEEYGGFLIEGLKNGLLGAVKGVGSWVDTHVTGPILGAFKNLLGINSPSKVFDEYGGYLMEGLENGIEGSEDLPKNALTNAQGKMKDVFGAVKELLSWASLGSKLMEVGLIVGIVSQTPALLGAVEKLESDMRTKVTENLESWRSAGSEIATSLSNGISSGANWWNLGSYIIEGIYNGVLANSGRLYALAWNTAVEMYNSAARALGIASPSKKFYWIAEMMTEGMANGIEDTRDSAIGAVASLADAVVDTAEEANPIIPVSAGMDEFTTEFEGVLTSFADKVTDSFANLISSMERIASGSSFVVPAVAAGTAVPYAVNTMAASSSGRRADTELTEAVRMLLTQGAGGITRQDLRNDMAEILTATFRYYSPQFYIGDEQIARHGMSGALELQRRGVL